MFSIFNSNYYEIQNNVKHNQILRIPTYQLLIVFYYAAFSGKNKNISKAGECLLNEFYKKKETSFF